jgi:molecular chaperone DnaK (HSP70)
LESGEDLRTMLTRDAFEGAWANLTDRFTAPLDAVLSQANMTID